MIAFDGNESLKCLEQVGDRAVGDTRVFTDSDYYLQPSFVDPFAHEVKSRWAGLTPNSDNIDANDIAEEDTEDDTTLASCADNWKEARSDSKKQAWGIFRVNGLFASACRHALVLWIADMIRSGEQYVALSPSLSQD
jgi:hypothetical protein